MCAILSGFFVYLALSTLFVETRIALPNAIVMAALTFGLTNYYRNVHIVANQEHEKKSSLKDDFQNDTHIGYPNKVNRALPIIIFVTSFAILIFISSLHYEQEFHIFTDWKDISIFGIVQLSAAILLCFFIPGYSIVLMITKRYRMNRILSVLLGYLLSMLITGLTAYILSLPFDKPISESKSLFIAVYIIIFMGFLIYYFLYMRKYSLNLGGEIGIHYYFNVTMLKNYYKNLKMRSSELLVIGSLLGLVIIYTYYLYGGVTIGDQWYHQGRSLLFMSGSFREAAISNGESFYPPLQSALIAALATISAVPLVNAYASIAFLSITPAFAFYYFFLTWIPITYRRAGLLAFTLFIVSSGFGWIYLFAKSTISVFSPQSALDTLMKIQVLDIVRTSNFVIPTAPDFSTGLIYISLPAGFVLLAMLRTMIHTKHTSMLIITGISLLGIMAHYEYYLFIIVSSLLPLLFAMKTKSYVYIGLLFALFVGYLMDTVIPGKFFTSNEILGFPILFLAMILVVGTWMIYLSGAYLYNYLRAKLYFLDALRKLLYHNTKLKFLAGVTITIAVAYLYLLSFNILNQESIEAIIEQTRDSVIPWYLYPMRLGIAGIFGLAFILSYLFKRFEKHVFIFGVIIVTSLLLGPYYDENRFSKYVMIGIVGFASLMIYEVLSIPLFRRPFYKGALVGIIIVPSCLSMLIFIGYNSLILQTQDFIDTLSRRHFPSLSQLHLFETLHNKDDTDSRNNVVSFLNEYDGDDDGIMGKIQAFSGLPYNKIRLGSSTLNSSTIDALYRLLFYNDARYIIIPKDSIQSEKALAEPIRFVLEHFRRLYEDDKYIVLDAPYLVPPTSSSNTEVALVYNRADDSSLRNVSNSSFLHYDNKTFDINANEKLVTIVNDNLTESLNLLGSNSDKGVTVWSKNMLPEKRVNFVEAIFQITSENVNKSNDIRLEWQESDKQDYYVRFSKDGLDLYQKSINTNDRKILSKNTEIEKKQWNWYKLRVESLRDSINVYVNNVPKIQISRSTNDNTESISKLGLTSYYNDVQFKSLKIGNVSDLLQKADDKSKNYEYNYPLSLLALSDFNYGIFTKNDLETLSKEVIFVSDNLKFDNVTYNKYLDYVSRGGTLIVINSNNNFNQTFSQLFSLHTNDSNSQAFTKIASNLNHNASMKVPGLVKPIQMQSFPGINMIASYHDSKNNTIAPFAIERIFSGGRIVLLNAEGYLNTLSDSPKEYFSSLSNISTILGLDIGKFRTKNPVNITLQNPQDNRLDAFLGKMEISGEVTLNSSSLLLPDERTYPYIINASRITIHDESNYIPTTFTNVLVKSLRLSGNYEASIKTAGLLELPDIDSERDYLGVQIPADSNLTINIPSKEFGQMELVIQNGSSINSIEVNNNSKIEIFNIKGANQMKSVPIFARNPNVKVNGNVSIANTFPAGNNLMGPIGLYGTLQGELEAKIDFIDHYSQPYRNGTKTQYVTYLSSLETEGSFDRGQEQLKLPGDIHFEAKVKGYDVPLQKVLTSSSNVITLIILISISIPIARYVWLKKKI